MSSTPLPRGFARLAWSNLAAQAAEQIGLAAAPLVAVLALGAGAGATGLLQAAQTLPFLLLSIPAGVLADRVSRRRLMAGAEAVRAASLLVVLALAVSGLLTLPLLALLGFLGAAGTVAYNVGAPALVPALVPRAALSAANGRLELARSTAFAAGPALGGVLVGWVGAAPAFGVAASLSLAAVILLSGLAEPARPSLPPRRVFEDLREGAGFVLTHPLLRPVLVTAVFFNVGFFVLQAVYVPYAVHHLGLTASAIGATLATYGIGMVSAALAAPRIARALPFGAMIAVGPIAGLAASLVMVATIWVPSVWLAALSFFLIGAGPILWTIGSTTLRQSVTPERMLGRVSAMIAMASFGARPIGAALGALVGAASGAASCVLLAALGFLVQAVVILVSPVPRLARQPEMTG
ncbi:MAG: MFS transporter [Alphaproteobacteria bacterium]|nr:MFS transporter [Alphaproteobacteria bacterium]